MIAGPNNAGKSYTIKRIAEVLRAKNPEAKWERRPARKKTAKRTPAGPRPFKIDLELTDEGPPSFALLRQNTRHMLQCGPLNLQIAESRYELPDDLPDYRLRTSLAASSIPHRVLNSLDEVDEGTMDLCSFEKRPSRVVPEDAARVLQNLIAKIDAQHGSIAVLLYWNFILAER